MRKLILICLLLIVHKTSFGQQWLRFGVSGSITIARPLAIHNNTYGKVTPGLGMMLHFPVSVHLSEQLSIETGVGYFYNKYKITYDEIVLSTANGSPFFPLELSLTKNKFFVSAGMVLQTAFASGSINSSIVDTPRQVTIIQDRVVKPCTYLHLEFGYKKTTPGRQIHQVSLQLFYGLQKQTDNVAYHNADPGSSLHFIDKGHFASVGYTFWFGKKVKDEIGQ
jgi:hypothetical protein